jgi:hypothetical protein
MRQIDILNALGLLLVASATVTLEFDGATVTTSKSVVTKSP